MKELVKMKFGSHLYHLDTPNSDLDIKGIFLPTLDELLLGDYPNSINHTTGNSKSKNTADDVDYEMYSLPYFISMAISGETISLDMLRCETPLVTSPVWEELVSKRTMFYSKDMSTFVDYVRNQSAKYGIKGSRLSDISRVIAFLKESMDNGAVRLTEVWDDLPTGDYLEKATGFPKSLNGKSQNFYVVNSKNYQETLEIAAVVRLLHKMHDGYGERAKRAEKNDGID